MIGDPTTGRVVRDFIPANFTSYGPRDFGFPIRSLEIDNPTGQWLKLGEAAIRVPPYTINWRIIIQPSARTLTITPIPVSGFSATQIGDAIRIVVRDYEIEPVQGISLVPTQPVTAFEIFPALFDDATYHSLISVPANQRARLYMIGASYSQFMYASGVAFIPFNITVNIGSFGDWATIGLNAESPTEQLNFGPGLDLGAGVDITVLAVAEGHAGAAWAADVYAVYTLL